MALGAILVAALVPMGYWYYVFTKLGRWTRATSRDARICAFVRLNLEEASTPTFSALLCEL